MANLISHFNTPPPVRINMPAKVRRSSSFGGPVPERLKILLNQVDASPEAPAAIFDLWEAHVASWDDFYMGGQNDMMASDLAPAIAKAQSTGKGEAAIFAILAKHIRTVGNTVP
jgi:hypothetical protein